MSQLSPDPEMRGNWSSERFPTWHQEVYLPDRWAERKVTVVNEAITVFPDFGIQPVGTVDAINAAVLKAVEAEDVQAIRAIVKRVKDEYDKIGVDSGKWCRKIPEIRAGCRRVPAAEI